ncbi:hypothetical protein TPHA_0C04180 [Tetrapisispora phaffii CBS 4417]|uniref:N-alpha-acetyltransferase 40 n=1 Tax=Tetrapisispora phaffii (strain ATCC 24235 / CBS 4417 / NBRC 1672 / NRRL Y-8282 / UCD 70-5) TaxID=1071381 RepID=G8BQQ6_TETPH|nr:hypothetical protein TPHA_0C04180 [Tetrapisispora phaffii CBS 4417]CCE62568.1 hypothetical protein TPHA_0C04180 [Tetrapisispora phaffii CBS 4417]
MDDIVKFVKIVDSHYPDEIYVNKNLTKLVKKIIVVDSETEDIKNSAELYNGRYLTYSQNKEECEIEFSKILTILDNNLGDIYTIKNKKLYGNSKPWKENKIQEMKTEGLIYVVYHLEDEKKTVSLYLSFTLTKESGFLPDIDVFSPVIYLYEIQLTPEVRNNGLGTKLIAGYLKDCLVDVHENIHKDIIGIELTVFSDNTNAIRFYETIGMKLTPDSPNDKTINYGHRIKTRSQNSSKKGSSSDKPTSLSVVKKPDYYLYYLPL